MEADYRDKSSWNQPHAADISLMKHYNVYGPSSGAVLVVSLIEQTLRYYNNGKLVRSFLIVTGQYLRPSPPGFWSIILRQHPTQFKSTEPPGSAFWYPPTPIQYAMEYHAGGYFFHDSWWRADYGPGMNFPHSDSSGTTAFNGNGSHGCINMNPNDVQTMQIGSSPAMMASLEKGGIDAAVLTEPTFFFAEDQGYRVLADLGDMDIYYLHSMIDTTRAFIRTHHDLALRFLRGYIEGIAFFKKNRKESIDVLARKLRTAPSQTKYLERSHALYSSGYFENTPYPSLKGVNTVLEFLAKDNPKARTADPRSFIDNSLVKELDDSGFIKKLYD